MNKVYRLNFLHDLAMGKISASNKMRIESFQNFLINLLSVKNTCQRVYQRTSAAERKPGSGGPTADNIEQVDDLICSQKTHREPARAQAILPST